VNVVQRAVEKTIREKIVSGLVKVAKGGGTVITALLMPQQANAPGPDLGPRVTVNSDGDLIAPDGSSIDERHRLDDKIVRTEGESDSPIRRLGDSDSFSIVDEDEDSAMLSTEVGSETLEIMGDFNLDGDTLTIDQFSVEGSSSNKIGIKTIKSIMKQLGKDLGVKTIVTKGTPRTTGANPGKVTELTFDIDKL